MGDGRSNYLHAFAHERGQAGPSFCRHHGAVNIGFLRLDVYVGATSQNDFGFAGAQRGRS